MPMSMSEDFSTIVFRANVHVLRFRYPREHLWNSPEAYAIVEDLRRRLNRVLKDSCQGSTGLLSSWDVDRNLRAAMPTINAQAEQLRSLGLDMEIDAFDCPQGGGLIGLHLEVYKLPVAPCIPLEPAS